MSKYRQKVSRRKSRKQFTSGAMRINRKNIQPLPYRGGLRL